MKRWFAIILAAAIALSMASCTAEQPPETTPPTTTAATTEATTEVTTEPVINSFTIGNIKFTLEPEMTVRETRFGTYIVTVVPGKAKAEFIASDISHIREESISDAVADQFEAYAAQRGNDTIGESDFTISFGGFDATGETYSKHDGENIKSTHMDLIFTDTWYAYIVLYSITDTDAAHDYGETFGRLLSSVEYIGQPHREPTETEPEETQKPQNTQQEKPPKETTPPETSKPAETEPPATTAPKATEPPATTQPPAGPTTGEQNALKKAKDYLRLMAFSYQGLIEQLEYEGFTTAESTYAADNCGADWNEQALKKAKDYLDMMPFSYSGLIKQLQYEDYTKSQATYGADNCGADWYEQAVRAAKNYLDLMSFSRAELISQLEYEGYTHDQAVYGAEQNGL